ncbi:MAG: sulfatase family protein [Anaerolineales bacterium]
MTVRFEKPNIIFIMADDMGYGDVGCYGSVKIQTPHMDRLASEGMRFTDAHSSSAVCTPSRYSVLTGRYCWRTSLKKWVLWGFEPPLIEPQRQTVAALLKKHGYATAAIGKWHLGLGWTTLDGNLPLADGTNVDYQAKIHGGPRQLGFDTNFNITGSLDMAPYCFIEDDHVFKEPTIEKYPYHPQQRSGLMSPGWQDDQVDLIFTEKAVAFIDQHASHDRDQPFFLYLTPSAPHRPCEPPDFIHGRSQAGLRGDMVALVDWMVGQIDDALRRHGMVENTLMIVTSDNGARVTDFYGNDYGHKSCGNLRGQKADIWDGGHREPLIARWPGIIKPGSTSDGLVCLSDLMATCAEILDIPLQENTAEDSFSFLPALHGELGECLSRKMIVHHSGDGMFSIRDGKWKLIQGCGSGGFTEPQRVDPEAGEPQGQLYNMQDDIQETCNLWAVEPQIVERLTALLTDLMIKGNSRF